MSETKTTVGSLVQLKSGGPEMTVTGHDPEGTPICTWFDGRRRQCCSFPALCLVTATGCDVEGEA